MGNFSSFLTIELTILKGQELIFNIDNQCFKNNFTLYLKK